MQEFLNSIAGGYSFVRPAYDLPEGAVDYRGAQGVPSLAEPKGIHALIYRPGRDPSFLAGNTPQGIKSVYEEVLQTNVAFAYDPQTYRANLRNSGALASPEHRVVNVKQLLADVFPSQWGKDTTIESAVKTLLGEELPGTFVEEEKTPGYLRKLVEKAYAESPEITSRHVEGIRQVIDPDDPFGIYRRSPSGLSSRGSSAYVEGRAGDLDAIKSAMGDRFDPKFIKQFSNMFERIAQKSKGEGLVATLFDDRLFIGFQTFEEGHAKFFTELPLQRKEGLLSYRGRTQVAPRIYQGHRKVSTAASNFLARFETAFNAEFSQEGRSVASLFAGQKGAMTMFKGLTFGESIKSTSYQGGDPIRYEALVNQYNSLYGKGGVPEYYKAYSENLVRIAKSYGKTSGLVTKLKKGLQADFQNIANKGGDVTAYFLTKSLKDDGRAILPSSSLHSYFWQGSYTNRDLEKGNYAFQGRRGITHDTTKKLIKENRKAAGLASRVAGVTRGAHLTERQIGSLYGTTRAVVEMPVVMGIIGDQDLLKLGQRSASLFGDTGSIGTARLRGALSNRMPLAPISIRGGREEALNILRVLQGKSRKQGWKNLRENLFDKGGYSFDKPLKIDIGARKALLDKAGIRVPRGAKYLTAVKYSPESQAFDFRFSTQHLTAPTSAVLVNHQKTTIQFSSSKTVSSLLGDFNPSHVDVFVSPEQMLKMGRDKVLIQHMTELAAYSQPGQRTARVNSFVKEVNRLSGSKILRASKGRIISTELFSSSVFLKHAPVALKGKLGFSTGQVYGLEESMRELFDKGVGAKFTSTNLDLEELANLSPKHRRMLFSSLAQRYTDTSDIYNSRGFTTNLETMWTLTRNIRLTSGVKDPGGHPAIKKLAREFKRKGITLDLNAKNPEAFVKQLPSEISNIFKAYTKEEMKGVETLTRKEAAQRFTGKGGLHSRFLNRDSAITLEEMLESELLRSDRKGFVLQLDDYVSVPSKLGEGEEIIKRLDTNRLYVPSGKELRKFLKMSNDRHGLFGSLLNLLEQPGASLSGDATGGSSLSPMQAIESYHTNLLKLMGKDSYLTKTRLGVTDVRGASVNRITQRVLSNGQLLNNEEVYKVGINRRHLYELARSNAGPDASKEQIKKEAKRIFTKIKEKKLFAALSPRPQHSSSHVPIVELFLDSSIRGSSVEGQHALSLHAFLANFIDRDMDKDTINLMLLDSQDEKASERIVRFQEKYIKRNIKAFGKGLAVGEMADESIKLLLENGEPNMDLILKKALTFYNFGTVANAPFINMYGSMSYTQQIAEGKIDDIVDYLNKTTIGKGKATAGTVSSLRREFQERVGQRGMQNAIDFTLEFNRNILQSAIQKGGSGIENLANNFLNLPYEVRNLMERGAGHKEALDKFILRTEDFLRTLADDSSIEFDDLMAKFKVGASTADEIQALAKQAGEGEVDTAFKWMAQRIGSVYGIAAVGGTELGAVYSSPFRRGLKGASTGILDMLSMLLPGARAAEEETLREATEEISEMLNSAKEATEETAEDLIKKAEIKAAQQIEDTKTLKSLENAWGFVKKHKKGLAVGVGGLLALRWLSGKASAAPLPPEPLFMEEDAGPAFPIRNSTVSLMPNAGYSSISNIGANYSTENISSELLNRENAFNSLQISDTRRFKSNFDIYQMQDKSGLNDFSHQYQQDGY